MMLQAVVLIDLVQSIRARAFIIILVKINKELIL